MTAVTTRMLTCSAASHFHCVCVAQLELGGTLRDSRFSGNAGLPPDLWRLAEAGCGRDDEGGGGALCVSLLQSVFLLGCDLDNNTAVSGGGLFLKQQCPPGGEGGCGPAVLRGTALRGNTALRGGGGAFFQTTHNLTDLYCSPGQAVPLPYEGLTVGCPEWAGNTAG